MQGLTFNPTYLTSPHQGKDSCTEILTRASDPQSLVFYKVSPDVLAPSQYTSGPLRGRTGTSWNAQEGHGVLLPAVLAPALLGVGAAVAVPRSTPTVA